MFSAVGFVTYVPKYILTVVEVMLPLPCANCATPCLCKLGVVPAKTPPKYDIQKLIITSSYNIPFSVDLLCFSRLDSWENVTRVQLRNSNH